MYVFGCGVTWAALQFCWFQFRSIEPAFDMTTVGYGLAGGSVLALANILLIESLTHLNVSLGSTIYRLNTIGVVILSFLLLNEPMGLLKTAGVLFGILAVWTLYDRNPEQGSVHPLRIFLWISILASLFRAVFGIISKAGLQAGADADAMLIIYALSWVVGGLIYACLREMPFRLTGKKVAYGVLSGVLLSVVVNALVLALTLGEVSVVAPIANLSFMVALLISVVVGMEELNRRKGVAVAGAFISIVLLAQSL